jgi:hypothetical protein
MAMKGQSTIKRMSLYIPHELADKVKQSAILHRRSFNSELLWLAECSLVGDGSVARPLLQTERQLNLEQHESKNESYFNYDTGKQ